ncbi:hypothetical protein H098_12305 [Pseudomonas fluorescens FH5]|nr:hypothetical protein H098_12305 [Pseudomonas fluorescens FH5]
MLRPLFARLAPKLRFSVLELMAVQFPARASVEHVSVNMVIKQRTAKRDFKHFMSSDVPVSQELAYVKQTRRASPSGNP